MTAKPEDDYYKILGVSKTASEDEIKKAYRKVDFLALAKEYLSSTVFTLQSVNLFDLACFRIRDEL